MEAILAYGAYWPRRVEESPLDAVSPDTDWRDIRASLHGDEDAFARLARRYQPMVFNQMWRFTRDPRIQEELVEEVLVEVFKSLRRYKGTAPFLHWVRRIATRVGYQYWKREARKRRHREALAQYEQTQPEPPERMAPVEAAGLLHELLAQLAPKDRLVLTLMYFEDCDVGEAAERTGWNANLVRVRAHRARQRLKRLLEDAGFRRTAHE